MNANDNNAAELLIAKLLEKKVKDFVPLVGETNIDMEFNVHVKGTIKKSADVEFTPTISIPLKMTVALLLAKMGFQRDKAMALLVESMTEALTLGEKGEDKIAEHIADVDAAMERVTAVTAALPKQIRKGPTNIKGAIEISEVVKTEA